MAAVREALLKRLRVNATSLSLLRNPKPSLNGLFALTFNAVHRRFSDDVMGSFLDKSEVTDRVVSVVKNFQKVDPSKIICTIQCESGFGWDDNMKMITCGRATYDAVVMVHKKDFCQNISDIDLDDDNQDSVPINCNNEEIEEVEEVPTISLTYQKVVADNSVYVKTPLMMLGYRNLMGRGGLQEWLVHAFELNKGGIDVGVADFLGKMRVEQQECDLLDSIYDEYPKESEDV
ncbi:hypothetical protein GOBAR_AA00314 [Gossypium barbadense]|uniref:Myb/SANT-like domain-containing protein n=1 Tax=Gossypium barbadense TaxID=3634 RepID=A0A2P5YXD9_GOSBA|nr:hypothetical protein GOBAR_AA00314 [Gossypium barbadense]